MTVVWIIVGVALVAVVVGMVVLSRRRAGVAGTDGAEQPLKPPQAEEPLRSASQDSAAPTAQEPPVPAIPEPKPEPTVAELRAQVESVLTDSDRLLAELGQLAPGGELEGSVGLLGEGLQEVRALAGRREWSQARDKGQALRAQLTMMLQAARRE